MNPYPSMSHLTPHDYNVAISTIFRELKIKRQGLTLLEISQFAGNQLDLTVLCKELLESKDEEDRNIVLYDDGEGKFFYNFKYKFFNAETLYDYLLIHKLLVVDEDAEDAHPDISADIDILRENNQILLVELHHNDVIFLDTYDEGDLPRRMDMRIR